MAEIKAVQFSEILQRCMEYCSAAGSIFGLWTLSYPTRESSCQISAQSVEKWLRYRLIRVSVGWGGWWGVVGSDALPSSSPSLIWL